MDERLRNKEHDPSNLVARLKGIDVFNGIDGQKLDQQLTRAMIVIIPATGSGELSSEASRRPLRADHAYICPAGGTFGIQAERGGELSVYMARFDLLYLSDESGAYTVSEAGGPAGDQEREQGQSQSQSQSQGPQSQGLQTQTQGLFSQTAEISLQPASRAAQLCREMLVLLESGDSLCKLKAQVSGSELVHMLLAAAKEEADGGTIDALERSRAYMDNHYMEEITLEKLAALAELSPKYYVDVFKKTYGTSAFDYLAQVRMRRAKQLMLRTELRLKDIAHEVGYGDEFYFSRKFKKAFGISPSVYLKKRGRRIAAYGSVALTGFLLPLGIIPYAAPLHPKWSGFYCDRYGADIAVHLNAYRNNMHQQANLERLAQAEPGLIIADRGLEPWEKAALKAIAPVYYMPEDRFGWRNKLLELAAHVDERDEAQRWIAEFDRKARWKRERLQAAHGPQRILVAKLLKNQLYAHCCYSFGCLLHDELGLLRAYPEEAMHYNYPITSEQLDGFEADKLLLLICRETETLEYWKKLQQSTGWMSSRLVRDNKVRLVSSEPWREFSPIALERMLEEAEAIFTSGYRP